MRYFVPFKGEDGERYYLELKSGTVHRGQVDIFSKVSRPALTKDWDKGLKLTKYEKKQILKSKIAYTVLYEETF